MPGKFTFNSNPIIVKELRSRMRGPRPFITITVMLFLLAGITYGIYRITLTSLSMYSGIPISPQIGQSLFVMLSFLLLIVICILTPAVTAGAISSEREQLTYEMLLSTPLHPAKILWGKLFSSLSYIFLLIFSAIPIASLIFVFGGVTLREMLKAFAVLIIVAITLGVFGIFMSSLLKRTSRATVVSYILIVLITFGSMVIYIGLGILQNGIPPRWIIAINPISALASALSNVSNQYGSVLSFIPIIGVDLNSLGGDAISFTSIPRPLYHYSLPLYGFIAIILYALSTRLVMPTRRWKISRKEILIFMSALFILSVLIAGAFFFTTDHYEQAINQSVQNFSGPVAPMRDPFTVQAMEVAVEEIKKPIPGNNLDLGTDEQANLYAQGITDAVLEFESENQVKSKNIYLVETVKDTLDGESYLFSIPTPLQISISEKLESLAIQINWVTDVETVFNNPQMSFEPTDIVINMGDIKFIDENTVGLYITINVNGVVESQTQYTMINKDNEWKIDSIERVFDASQNN